MLKLLWELAFSADIVCWLTIYSCDPCDDVCPNYTRLPNCILLAFLITRNLIRFSKVNFFSEIWKDLKINMFCSSESTYVKICVLSSAYRLSKGWSSKRARYKLNKVAFVIEDVIFKNITLSIFREPTSTTLTGPRSVD